MENADTKLPLSIVGGASEKFERAFIGGSYMPEGDDFNLNAAGLSVGEGGN